MTTIRRFAIPRGRGTTAIHLAGGRTVRVRTVIDMRSDAKSFYVIVSRRLYVRDVLVRTKTWTDTLPRGIH